jgi:hypothetical protein
MKPHIVLIAVLLGAAVPAVAHAQSPPAPARPRADVAGTIGWLSGNKSTLAGESHNDWYNRGLYGGVTAGWYWTEHHKMEVEAGLTNDIDFQTYRSTYVDGVQAWGGSVFNYTLRRVAVGELYQGLHNAWVHPYAGAGVDLTWERSIEHRDRVMAYDPRTGMSRELSPPATIGPTTTLRVRPYLETGFKAYVSPRAFFRGDLRLIVYRGIDEVVLRCGFGVDF